MSYTIDVYRGDTRAQRSSINFGTFVTLFPQLIAGPIIKYKDLGLSLIHISGQAEPLRLSKTHIKSGLPLQTAFLIFRRASGWH